MNLVSFNGRLYPADAPVLPVRNRGFRYGDGLFETMKVLNGQILLASYHFDRLWLGLQMLQMSLPETFNRQKLEDEVLRLCSENKLVHGARVRLGVFRNEENRPEYAIETMPLPEDVNRLNEKGWSLDLYPFARKSCDAISNLKSANYLIYILAGLYASEKTVDESIVLNTENNLCDGSKTNIFLVERESVYTPALHQGCVNGVMRRYLIEQLKELGIPVHQKEISEEQLLQADEVFVSNAIIGLRWVGSYRNRQYGNGMVKEIYQKIVAGLFH